MRLSDAEVAEEFLRLKGHVEENSIKKIALFLLPLVEVARSEEPRINSGLHLLDYTMICDDDDTFESFYGENYFKEISPQ